MIVPLMSRGEVIGTIGMPTSDPDRIFTSEEVNLAQTIASQVAGAIENARLFEVTEKAKESAEQELEIGRKIQSDFFPQELPKIPGWDIAAHFQAARRVTGDFYDIISMEEGRKVVAGKNCIRWREAFQLRIVVDGQILFTRAPPDAIAVRCSSAALERELPEHVSIPWTRVGSSGRLPLRLVRPK